MAEAPFPIPAELSTPVSQAYFSAFLAGHKAGNRRPGLRWIPFSTNPTPNGSASGVVGSQHL